MKSGSKTKQQPDPVQITHPDDYEWWAPGSVVNSLWGDAVTRLAVSVWRYDLGLEEPEGQFHGQLQKSSKTRSPDQARKLLKIMVPEVGLEPTRS